MKKSRAIDRYGWTLRTIIYDNWILNAVGCSRLSKILNMPLQLNIHGIYQPLVYNTHQMANIHDCK